MHGNGQEGGENSRKDFWAGRQEDRKQTSEARARGRGGHGRNGRGWGRALPHADGAQHRKETRSAVPENLAGGIRENSLSEPEDYLS